MQEDNAERGSGGLERTEGQGDKGKSKVPQDDGATNEPSMMSRLQDSAKMAGGALSNNRGSSPNVPSSLEGKGMQFGSSSSSTRPGQHQTAQSNTARYVQTTAQGETFRHTQWEAPRSTRAFNDFIDTHEDLPDVGGARLDTQYDPSDTAGWSSSGADIAQASAVDGSAVADLLCQPDDPIMMPTMDDQIEIISAENAAKLRAALFDSPSSGDLPWDHLLNFTPDFASVHSFPGESRVGGQALLASDGQDSSASNWLRQWRGVLTGYTDEVWGDLGMLVEGAKRELEDGTAAPGEGRTETPALSRLKMILAHIRGDS